MEWEKTKQAAAELLHEAHAIYFDTADVLLYIEELPYLLARKVVKIQPKLHAEIERIRAQLRELSHKTLCISEHLNIRDLKLRDGRQLLEPVAPSRIKRK